MKSACRLALLLALVVAPLPAHAVNPDEMLQDKALEARARALSSELRCMVCQNQSIDDSDAPLAKDLRILVRERLTAGDSDAAVRDFLVSRYGDFILLKPPLKPSTFLLWGTPFAILAIGAAAMLARARAKAPERGQTPLSEAEKTALDRLTKAEPER